MNSVALSPQYYSTLSEDTNTSFRKNQRLKVALTNLRDWVERKGIGKTYRHTMEHCVRLAIYQLIEHEQLFKGLDPNNLPGFHTYTPSLASMLGCTVRTLQNHKKKLFKLGFFTQEKRRGQYGYEVWINNEIILTDQNFKFYFDTNFSSPSNPDELGIAKELRGLVPELFQEPTIKKESKVEKCISPPTLNDIRSPIDILNQNGGQSDECVVRCDHKEPRNLLDQEAESSENEVNSQNASSIEKDFGGAGAPGPNLFSLPQKLRRQVGQAPDPGPPARERSDQDLLIFVTKFWNVARSLLYPDLEMWPTREKEICNVIWANVFNKFKIKDYEYWDNRYHNELINRLRLASKWQLENKWKFPDPKAYFDPSKNKYGFHGTFKMMNKYFANAKLWERDKVIDQLKKVMDQYDKGKGRHVKKKRKELIQLLIIGVQKRKDPQLLEEISLRFNEIFKIPLSNPDRVKKRACIYEIQAVNKSTN